MKIRLPDVRKRCLDGEVYIFKKGIAQVPGVRFQKKPAYITLLAEFKNLQEEKP